MSRRVQIEVKVDIKANLGLIAHAIVLVLYLLV